MKYPASRTFFSAWFSLCTSRSRGRHSRRLACLRSHVLRAYCNFESKQANSITLFGRRPDWKPFWSCARQPELKAFPLKISTHKSTVFYFYATISSPRSNGAKMSKYKPKGQQKIIFLSSSDKLNNSSWYRNISNNVRPHFGNKLQVNDIIQRRKSFNTLHSASNIYCSWKN